MLYAPPRVPLTVAAPRFRFTIARLRVHDTNERDMPAFIEREVERRRDRL